MDQDAINLAKAIRQTESGGDFNAKGASGESGAYQWTPSTWKAHAQEALGNANAPMTPDNQNAVAYTIIKKRKDAGLNPAQIAAEWNSGSSTGWENKVGTNQQGVHYDVPQYVKSVTSAYQQYKGGAENPNLISNSSTVGGYNPKPFTSGAINVGSLNLSGSPTTSTAPQEAPASIVPNLGEVQRGLTSGIAGRVNDFGGALQPLMKGDVASAGIQAAGAIAGGVGDVINAGTQLIPGVQGAEKVIGSGVKALMSTQTGQDVASAFQKFAQSNPTIAKDIGAGVNILAAIPLLHGFGALKTAVMDAGTLAFKDSVTAAAEQEIKDNLTKNPLAAVTRATSRGVDPIKTMVSTPNYLPDVVPSPTGGFMYNSGKARGIIDTSLSADETALQAKLDQAITGANQMVSITDAEKQVLKDIQKEYSMSGNYLPAARAVGDYFESIKASSGGRDMISLNELNALKRDVRNTVFDVKGDIRGSASAQIKYQIGQSLMDQVEAMAKKAGIDGVPEINKEMGRKLEVLKVLDAMDGHPVKVKPGLGKETAAAGAMAVGEMAGNAVGLPFAGTLAGRGLVGKVLNRTPRTAVQKLSSLKPNVLGRASKGLKQLGTGVAAQGLVSRTTGQ